MRAAMTYAFGRLYSCGNRSWQMDESRGVMVGNPSISTEVSDYMLALHRRKVSTLGLIFQFYLSSTICLCFIGT